MSTPSGTFATLADLGAASTPEQATFVSAQTIPNVTFNETNISPPSNLYVAFDDLVFMQVLNSNAGVTALELRLRVLTPDGQIKLFVLPIGSLNAARTPSAVAFQVDEGFILSAFVTIPPGTTVPHRGETFVLVALQRPGDAGSKLYQQFIADYISGNHSPAWPGGQYISSTEGPGVFRSITGTLPAAGAQIAEFAPAHVRWRLLAFQAVLGTQANVGNRVVNFAIGDGVNDFFQVQSPVTQPASVAFIYTLGGGLTYGSGTGTVITIPAPVGQALSGGYLIRTAVLGMFGTDQWAAPHYLVEEWIDF